MQRPHQGYQTVYLFFGTASSHPFTGWTSLTALSEFLPPIFAHRSDHVLMRSRSPIGKILECSALYHGTLTTSIFRESFGLGVAKTRVRCDVFDCTGAWSRFLGPHDDDSGFRVEHGLTGV